MPSTHKKVIVRKFDRESSPGYVGPMFAIDNRLEMLNTAGKVVSIPLGDVKSVHFVRELEGREDISRKSFASRPRSEGLWVRLVFRDQEALEGIMGNDLSQFAAEGFYITPPDIRGNTQKLFVPRSALQSLTVLGVVTTGMTKKRPQSVREPQPKLFAEAE